MRKIKSIILAAVLVLSMVGLMTACGKSEDSKDNNSSKETPAPTNQSSDKDEAQTPEDKTSGTEDNNDKDNNDEDNNASVFPEALSNVEAIPVPNLEYSGWKFSGGMIDGVEMDQSQADAILEACGGVYQCGFLNEGKAMMINGEKTFDGTYKVIQDNYAIELIFDGYEYYGVFTSVNGENVLILVNKQEPETAIYMTYIDEH